MLPLDPLAEDALQQYTSALSSETSNRTYSRRRATISIICLTVALLVLLAFDLGGALLGLSNSRLHHVEINLHPKLFLQRDLELNVYSKDAHSGYLFTTDVANLACAISYSTLSEDTKVSSTYLTTVTQLPAQKQSQSMVKNENIVNDNDEGGRRYDAILHKSDFDSMRGILWNATHASQQLSSKNKSFDFDCSSDVLVRLRAQYSAAFTIPFLSRQSWQISVTDSEITAKLGPITRSFPIQSRRYRCPCFS